MHSPQRSLLVLSIVFATSAALRAGEPEMIQLPQRGPILSAAFSPDGKQIAVAADKTVRVFELSSGREAARLEAGAKVGGIAFSPDGRHLAAVADGDTAQMWEISTAKVVWTMRSGQPANARGIAFTADGQRIAVAREATVCFCNATNGQQLLMTSFGGRFSKVIAPDGKTLVTIMNATQVMLWDIEKYHDLGTIDADPKAVAAVVFAADSKTLATAGSEKTVRLWDVATRKELHKIASTAEVRCLAFRPDGKTLAVASGDKWVRLYDIASGKETRRFGNVVGRINALAFSQDGLRLVTGGDEGVIVWDLTRDEKPFPKDFKLTAKELDALWTDLRSDDIRKSYTALRKLRAAPADSVPFLNRQFTQRKPVADEKKLAQLIADLDDDSFEVREKATDDLEKLGKAAGATIRRALADNPTAEARMRLQKLLTRLSSEAPLNADQTRDLMALRVLEMAGTPEARKALEALVRESAEWWVVREAKAALERLKP